MTNEDIIRMAREAGLELTMWQLSFGYETCVTHEELERFANIVAAAEREACARLCEELELPDWPNKIRQPLAAAIRARGQDD